MYNLVYLPLHESIVTEKKSFHSIFFLLFTALVFAYHYNDYGVFKYIINTNIIKNLFKGSTYIKNTSGSM